MQIEEVYALVKQKMDRMGYKKYTIKHRSFILSPNTTTTISAFNEYWFLKINVYGVSVKSDYGFSGNEVVGVDELVYDHTGEIDVTNHYNKNRTVEFIQVLPIK